MAGRDVLRVLWGEGVRVTYVDSVPRLTPPELITPEILGLATFAKPEIIAVVRDLPAPGRCPICGDPHNDPGAQAHCTDCSLIAFERYWAMGGRGGFEACDISRETDRAQLRGYVA